MHKSCYELVKSKYGDVKYNDIIQNPLLINKIF